MILTHYVPNSVTVFPQMEARASISYYNNWNQQKKISAGFNLPLTQNFSLHSASAYTFELLNHPEAL